MIDFEKTYPEYDVTKNGIIYKNGKEIKPFKSNKYSQVLLFDSNHKRKVCGVHTAVAMKYLDYYDGCVVHHIDGDTSNNCVENLEVQSRSKHSLLHSGNKPFRKGPPWNKGLKMSEEFCEKCSISAKNRWSKIPKKQKDNEQYSKYFRGNQYVDKNGNQL